VQRLGARVGLAAIGFGSARHDPDKETFEPKESRPAKSRRSPPVKGGDLCGARHWSFRLDRRSQRPLEYTFFGLSNTLRKVSAERQRCFFREALRLEEACELILEGSVSKAGLSRQ
jgi:hypothetical protein